MERYVRTHAGNHLVVLTVEEDTPRVKKHPKAVNGRLTYLRHGGLVMTADDLEELVERMRAIE